MTKKLSFNPASSFLCSLLVAVNFCSLAFVVCSFASRDALSELTLAVSLKVIHENLYKQIYWDIIKILQLKLSNHWLHIES